MSSYSGYGAPPWGNAAAHALSNLSLGKEGEERSGEGAPSSAYPPSFDTSNPRNSQQGPPYSASPISGVVRGMPYASPSPAYSYPSQYDSRTQSPPYEAPSAPPAPGGYPPSTTYPSSSPSPHNVPHSLNLPENLDVLTGGKGMTPTSTEALYPPQNSRSEGQLYPPAPSRYPRNLDESSTPSQGGPQLSSYGARAPAPAVPYPRPQGYDPLNFDESSTASQGFPKYSPYGERAPAPVVPYPQSEGYDGQGKQKTKKEFDSAIPNYDGLPSPQPGYPPGGSSASVAPMGYPPQQTAQSPAPARYPGPNFQPGELTSESSVNSSSEVDGDRGYKKDQHYGYGAGYPQRGYDQPGYSQPGYGPQQTAQSPAPARYPSLNFQPGGLPSESSLSPSSEGGGDGDRGYKKDQQYGYGAGYPPRGYDQPGYSQQGYGPQPTYPKPGHDAYPPHGYAPSYPPAYPGDGYAPEAYPSAAYGSYGYPPVTRGAYGAPIYGSQGEYKQHKGGHKGHKHKKMKKMKKGHYAHYGEDYGHHGGHHGHHGKHRKHKHKH